MQVTHCPEPQNKAQNPHLSLQVKGGFRLDPSHVAPMAPLGHRKHPGVFLLLQFTRCEKVTSWSEASDCRPQTIRSVGDKGTGELEIIIEMRPGDTKMAGSAEYLRR